MEDLIQVQNADLFYEREKIAEIILKCADWKIPVIRELCSDLFEPNHYSLEAHAERNTSYTRWIEEYNVTKGYVIDFPTNDLYNNYQRFCAENRYRFTYHRFEFFKQLEIDFNVDKFEVNDYE